MRGRNVPTGARLRKSERDRISLCCLDLHVMCARVAGTQRVHGNRRERERERDGKERKKEKESIGWDCFDRHTIGVRVTGTRSVHG